MVFVSQRHTQQYLFQLKFSKFGQFRSFSCHSTELKLRENVLSNYKLRFYFHVHGTCFQKDIFAVRLSDYKVVESGL